MSPQAPSMALLRSFSLVLRPSPTTIAASRANCPRSIHNTAARVHRRRGDRGWMPREKFSKITTLDKLHRRQRDARITERITSKQNAQHMIFAPSPILAATATTPGTVRASSTVATKPHAPSTPATTEPITISNSISSNPSTELNPLFPTAGPLNLPYLITRTASRRLPVYEEKKGSGTQHLTVIRKITGDVAVLQKHVHEALGFEKVDFTDSKGRKKPWVNVNWNTGHVVIKGWRGAEVRKWLELGGF